MSDYINHIDCQSNSILARYKSALSLHSHNRGTNQASGCNVFQKLTGSRYSIAFWTQLYLGIGHFPTVIDALALRKYKWLKHFTFIAKESNLDKLNQSHQPRMNIFFLVVIKSCGRLFSLIGQAKAITFQTCFEYQQCKQLFGRKSIKIDEPLNLNRYRRVSKINSYVEFCKSSLFTYTEQSMDKQTKMFVHDKNVQSDSKSKRNTSL